MTLLRWVTAARGDRLALSKFQCTVDPVSRQLPHGQWVHDHPAPHESRVQAMIRKSLNPPCAYPHEAWIGWDESGAIGAVVVLQEMDGPPQVDLDVVAVHLRFRRRGGGWAREAVRHALDTVTTTAHAAGVDVVEFGAWVHEDNRAAQKLLESFGLDQTAQRDDGYQRWARDVIVGGGMFDVI